MLTPIYISFNFFLFRHFLRLLIGLAEVQNWNVMAKEERKKNHDKPSATTWNSKWNVQHVIGPCSAAKFKINCSHSQLLAMVFACLFVCTYVSSVTIIFFSTFFFFRDDFRVVFGAPFVFAFDRYDLYSFSNSMMPRTIHNCLELFNQ